MYFLEKIKKDIADEINKILGGDYVKPEDFAYPPNPEMGDLSLPCFNIGKQLQKTPAAIISTVISGLKMGEILLSAKAAGAYLNLVINRERSAGDVLKEIRELGADYGSGSSGAGKRVMIEFSNVNTHKEFHIGHLRNICFGDAVSRILAVNGYQAYPVSYINDFGIHVAKTIWCYLEYYREQEPAENKGFFLGKVYVRASQELEGNQVGKTIVGAIMKKIETREGEEYELWQKTRQWSIDQFAKIYDELGVKFVDTFYESEFVDKGREMVNELLEKGVLIRSQGAVIADLEQYNLNVLMFLRSDGTALYPVADLPLALAKAEKYKLDKSIYVIDIRQSQYFKQLAKIVEQIGGKGEIVHLGYEVVKLPDGMMSSRTGNVITYEELKKLAVEKATAETAKRHEDWSPEQIKETAWKLVEGAMKFEMLKVGPTQIITFDIEKALRFEGYTAAYLQYVYVRIRSILKNFTKEPGENADYSKLSDYREQNLIMKLAKYPEAVKAAGDNCQPSEIAKYLFELGQMFNDYYHAVSIMKSEESAKPARLALIAAVSRVMANGLGLLGIKTMDEM